MQTLRKGIGFYQLFAMGFGTIIGIGWIIVAGSWQYDQGTAACVHPSPPGGRAGLCLQGFVALFPCADANRPLQVINKYLAVTDFS